MSKQSLKQMGFILITVWAIGACSSGGAVNQDDDTTSDGDTDLHSDSDDDAASDSDSDTDTDTDGDSDSDTDNDSDTDSDGDTDSDTDTDGDTDTDTDMDSDSDTDSDTDSDGDTDSDSVSDTDSDTDRDGDTEPATDSDSDTDSVTDSNTDSRIDTATAADTATTVETETEAGSDTETGGGKRDIFVGNITTMSQVRTDFLQYWNQLTPENEGKWESIEANRDNPNWATMDKLYSFTRDNGIPFKEHTFVWGNAGVSWIANLSTEDMAAEIEEWIQGYCERYPDTELIDVVNEPIPGHAPSQWARTAFGDDWIGECFRLARTHCPNSVLILNDYNVLSWNTDQFIELVTPVADAGLVDAFGLQAHGLEDRNIDDISSRLNQVAALGLPIYISEFDVDIPDDDLQRDIMQQQFTLFYTHPSVAGITLWGYVVGRTWVSNSGLITDNGINDVTFRPAMTWLMDYLGK
ncbi:MAG: endo-1,4-beta-xylanase [Deltaproteobacteria bacterium]|nr:endo-1,4-beta-xylanase [Deltaproteobacteria bacterium]